MIEKIAIKIVIAFVIRQLDKFKETTDWDKLQADLDDRVAKLVPGTWFDAEAIGIVHTAIAGIRSILAKGSNLKLILELLAEKKYDEAALKLKDLLAGLWGVPHATAIEHKARALLIA